MKIIEQIFSGELEGEETRNFEFRPAKHHKKAVGTMFTSDSSLSLSFDHGTDIKLNQFEFSNYTLSTIRTPDKRIFKLDQDLNRELVTGTITNTRKAGTPLKKINVYLIVEHEH